MTDVVNIGAADNDDAGDPLRAAFNKINIEFARLGITLQHVPLTSLPVASFIGPNDPHASMAAGYVPDADQKVATKGYADTAITAAGNALQPIAEKGVASGYTPLDATNHVPVIHLPSALAIPRKVFDNVVDMLAGTTGIHAGDGLLVTDDPVNAKNGEYVARVDHPTTMAQLWFLGDRVPVHRHGSPDIDTFLAGRVMTLDLAMREVLIVSGDVTMDGGYVPVLPTGIATKAYVDSVSGSIPTWFDTAYKVNALVALYGCIYMATEAIVAGDLAPDALPGAGESQKWNRITGIRVTVGTDADKPAFARDGDRHFLESPTEAYPREVIFLNGHWVAKAINVEIKEHAKSFGAFDQTIGLEIGNADMRKQILWLRGSEHGNDGWNKVDQLWNTAWGLIGNYYSDVSQTIETAEAPYLNNTVRVKKGRTYKVTFTGILAVHHANGLQLIHGHIKLGGHWVEGAECDVSWTGTPFANNNKPATLSAFGFIDWTADSVPATLQISLSASIRDATLEKGLLSIEDVGPT